jgi:PAS domain S-box-containing protein
MVITKFGSRLSIVLEGVLAYLEKAANALIRLGRTIANKPRRIKENRWARANDLRNLLASSQDAIVVTDQDRRLVAANSKALELFGISQSNMRNFSIDAFLADFELPDLDRNGSSFESREAGLNRCKMIRRLDGGLCVTECQFVASIVPRRHLYKFLHVAPYNINPPRFGKGTGRSASLTNVESPSNSIPNATVPAKKDPRHGVRPVFGSECQPKTKSKDKP